MTRTSSPGGHSVWVPPDPISNSEVKPFSADDSVVFRHVKVGHRRVLFSVQWTVQKRPLLFGVAFFRCDDAFFAIIFDIALAMTCSLLETSACYLTGHLFADRIGKNKMAKAISNRTFVNLPAVSSCVLMGCGFCLLKVQS